MDKYVIPNLKNACQLMKALAAQTEGGVRVADLARELKIPATSALRIVYTLEQEGFILKDHSGLRLGPSLIHLGHEALVGTEIGREAMPVLQALSQATSETAHVAVPCDGRSLIVAVSDSPHPLQVASRPGALTDLHCSSTGKVFLAYHFYAVLDATIAARALTRRTANTIVTAAALRKEVEAVRIRGYSTDEEEIHLGVRCLAAPVYGGAGEVVAAIGITAAAARFTPAKTEEMSRRVRQAATELSRRIGYNIG